MTSRNKKILSAFGLLATASMALTACGAAPGEPGASGAGGDNSDYLACIVSDEGGFDDRSFNELSYAGFKQAETELGIQTRQAESTTEGDYTENLNAMIGAGCNIIVPVGFKLADATQESANAHPDVHYAIVDVDWLEGDNILGLNYDTAQAAFLAGYAAAAKTESGTVATYGGAQLPTVTIFMDGFDAGVRYYNEQKGTDVKVLGWNMDDQKGSFVGDFTNQAKAKQITEGFLARGADIIMPVGGPLYQGGVEAIKDAGSDALIIGVDSDLAKQDPSIADRVFVSVQKGLDVTVFDAIKSDVEGKFESGAYTGTLENGGVSLSSFGEFEKDLPEGLTGELDQLKQDIIDGKIEINSPASPKPAQ
ncbi:BMP family ABC transporter substrate-binding protein [uncultured Gulosibacter sp.]|uniref:BMP family lipoprotein n=1 Tax=uncultured Gulosibacter sp. TaxID=1339167 RepID=UPI00288B8D64|nr:BMP family ABC transporter substrate-binding protein [uncultured Gulosibacter sp.]